MYVINYSFLSTKKETIELLIMETSKILHKIFQLIRLLNTPPAMDVPQLMSRLGVSKSAVYRDLKILEEIGYQIETDSRNRKSLKFSIPKRGAGILTLDDINFLQSLLESSKSESVRAETILKKFNRNLNLIPLADALPQLHKNYILQLIRAGVNTGRCLKLYRYRSLTSNNIKDRLVEPLEITEDERYLIAWDKDKNDQRQFKLDRIEDVDVLDQLVESNRIASPMDLFGLTGEEWLQVQLKLSTTAQHLLLEEFPLSRPFIRMTNQDIIFDGMVRNWKGIGRFVLGLPGEIEIIGPIDFKKYIQKRIGEF